MKELTKRVIVIGLDGAGNMIDQARTRISIKHWTADLLLTLPKQ